METLLVKTAVVTTVTQSSSFLKHHRAKMLTGALPGQLSILEVLLKEEKISCFDEILNVSRARKENG